jgi:hypothetical protein
VLLDSFIPGMRVHYVPRHALGNLNHPDCEKGTVSSKGRFLVFVKFDKQTAKFGWDGTTANGCRPEDLRATGAIDTLIPEGRSNA